MTDAIKEEEPLPDTDRGSARSRLAKTAVLLLLALLTYGGITQRVVGPLGYEGLQGQAETYLTGIRQRALEVFLAARASNGFISVIESMQVGPVVVEGKPGMLLEPVRETLDQLGEMMTVSVVTLEALELLREVGGRISFTVLIPLGFVVLAAGLWLPAARLDIRPLGKGMILAGLMLAVGFPLTIWAEKGIAVSLLEDQYNAAYQNVSQMQSGLSDHLASAEQTDQSAAPPADAAPTPAEQPSLLTRAGNWISSTFGSIRNVATAARSATSQSGMEKISQWLNDKVESVLKLMTIFLVEVFLLPSFLGYAIYRGLRSMVVRVVVAPGRLVGERDEM
jgi:hypothetical protein